MPLLAPDVGAGPFIIQSKVAALRRQVHRLERRPRLVVVQKTRVVYVTAPLPAPHTAFTAPSSSIPWECIHEHEGAWTADTGNGYYGGLQESLAFWQTGGGQRYAPRPDLATPAEQIAVAENVIAQGASVDSQWPVSGPECGA